MHPRRTSGRWRLLLAEPRSGAENMARDSALLARAAQTGETVFCVYSWKTPTLSFGRNQPARALYDVARLRRAGIDIVRRPTGGRAIIHHREVTYSVTAPLADAPPLRDAYSRINTMLMAGLARLGVPTALAGRGARAEAPSAHPCFEMPAEGELISGGHKLVGSAQWRDEGGLLQHGSILVDDDQSAIPDFLVAAQRTRQDPIPQPATLANLMGRSPAIEEVAAALFDAVRELEDSDATEMTEEEVRADTMEQIPHFLDGRWTWRR
jgi:lipoate-protein ligase A